MIDREIVDISIPQGVLVIHNGFDPFEYIMTTIIEGEDIVRVALPVMFGYDNGRHYYAVTDEYKIPLKFGIRR